MYYMFLDTMQVPVPPETMRTRIRNKNRPIDLINKGEINILKNPGLTEISFKILLPNASYPFNQSILYKSQKANYYVSQLEQFKTKNEPFQFICVRMTDGGDLLNMSNIKVTLEDYSINEDAKEGYDFYADILLKQYKEWGSKKIDVKTDKDGNKKGTAEQNRSTTGKTSMPESIVARKNDTLQTICKKYFGSALLSLPIVKSLNKIAVPGVLAVGQIIKLKSEQDAKQSTTSVGGIIDGTIIN